MKKLQILFAAFAIAIAGVGVFAKEATVISYWKTSSSTTPACTDVHTTPVCNNVGAVKCDFLDGSTTKYVTYKDASGTCKFLLREE